ncbi:MAG: fatty acid desaturase [Thiolinea sp.]
MASPAFDEVNYLAFAGLTLYYARNCRGGVVVPLAAYVLALFQLLAARILHGHPTPWRWLNEALLFPALTLWLPYPLYRESHLRHHNDDLTDPARDPEGFYLLTC